MTDIEELAGISEETLDSADNTQSGIIPENSGIISQETAISRFSSAVWFNKARLFNITVAGLGGIGRFGNLNNFYCHCA